MGDFVPGNQTDLTGQQRHHRDGVTSERHEFNGKALPVLMHQHGGADVALAQAVFGQVGRQNHAVEFFDHNVIHPMDTPWPM